MLLPLVISDEVVELKPNPTLASYFLEADRGAGLSSARLKSMPLDATTDDDPAVAAMLPGVARLLLALADDEPTGGLVEIRRHVFRFAAGGVCLVSAGRAALAIRGTTAAAGGGGGGGGDSAIGNDITCVESAGFRGYGQVPKVLKIAGNLKESASVRERGPSSRGSFGADRKMHGASLLRVLLYFVLIWSLLCAPAPLVCPRISRSICPTLLYHRCSSWCVENQRC